MIGASNKVAADDSFKLGREKMSSEIITFDEALKSTELVDKLNDMALLSKNLYRMYGSSDWLKSINRPDNTIFLLLHKSKNSKIDNILPFINCTKVINLLNCKLITIGFNLNAAEAIGCEILGDISEFNYADIVNYIFDKQDGIDCIYIKSISPETEIYSTLIESGKKINSKYFCFIESGPREFHSLSLKESFEAFLSMYSKKERYNLKRQCRLAREASGGELTLKRIASADDVEFFVTSSRQILNNSWKSNLGETDIFFSMDRCSEYSILAQNGLLRSYILLGNSEPWAFVLGYQWGGIFHYSNVAYDESRANLSPGTVLFYLMLEDLHFNNKPEILNFGIGNSFYKRRFGTEISSDCTLFIARKNIKNKLLAIALNIKNSIKNLYNNIKLTKSTETV